MAEQHLVESGQFESLGLVLLFPLLIIFLRFIDDTHQVAQELQHVRLVIVVPSIHGKP